MAFTKAVQFPSVYDWKAGQGTRGEWTVATYHLLGSTSRGTLGAGVTAEAVRGFSAGCGGWHALVGPGQSLFVLQEKQRGHDKVGAKFASALRLTPHSPVVDGHPRWGKIYTAPTGQKDGGETTQVGSIIIGDEGDSLTTVMGLRGLFSMDWSLATPDLIAAAFEYLKTDGFHYGLDSDREVNLEKIKQHHVGKRILGDKIYIQDARWGTPMRVFVKHGLFGPITELVPGKDFKTRWDSDGCHPEGYVFVDVHLGGSTVHLSRSANNYVVERD